MSHHRRSQFILLGCGLGATISAQSMAGGQIGPDVVGFYIAESINYLGTIDGIGGYAIGTTSCNYGDVEANWYSGTNNTPLIAQNAYRMADGRFEQIGMSWLKHSFCALSESGCGDCQPTDCSTLGIGCADTYGAGLNTNPGGPRSDVNAFTGFYNYPFNVSASGPSTLRGNLQIHNEDVDPSLNAGARYFFEGYYMSDDDAAWGNHANNASWREVEFDSISSIDQIGSTEVGEPAIRKWGVEDPTVQITEAHVADDGFFIVGAKATDLGGGWWNYEYAIWNHNCDASGGSFSVPIPDGTSVTNIGFHDVDYHSGEVYDGTDWEAQIDSGAITWRTTPHEQNANANALRWATMYNFRFDANVSPVQSSVTIGTFKPDAAPSTTTTTLAPPAAPIDPCDLPLGSCPEDVDGDFLVNVNDLLLSLDGFGTCGDGTFRPVGDLNDDCCVTVDDLLMIIGAWGQDCTPIGACCWPDGNCTEITELECTSFGGLVWSGPDSTCDSADCVSPGACCFDDGTCEFVFLDECASSGGFFQGEDVLCSDVECPIAGAGDECDFPFTANLGPNAFDTSDATPSQPAPDDSLCSGTFLDWGNSPDVWFQFPPDQSNNLTFHTCDPSSYDTSIAIYEESCENQIACNGDASGEDGCQSYYSSINLDVTSGQTYYIRIGGWQESTGAGTLTIE